MVDQRASKNHVAAPSMSGQLRARLSVMMFLQYFVWGAWAVTLGTYLMDTRHFTEQQVGSAYQTGPIATIIAPLIVGMFADRFFSTQRILGVLHLVGAALLYYASTIEQFWLLRLVLLLYFLCYMPTISLTNSLSFHHLTQPDREFPGIRVLGTIGWIAAGWLVGLLKLESQNLPMQIGAGVSLVLGVYCFFLPHTPPHSKGPVSMWRVLGLDALRLMRRWPFAVFVVGSFLICIPLQFYYNWANKFLNEIDFGVPALVQTFGQIAEIFFLLIMPWAFLRLGVKKMLLIGMAAWAIRYVLFAVGDAHAGYWLIIGGILLHGVCFDFFFLTGAIYVDRNAPVEIRAAAQGFLSLVTWGVSGVIGAEIAGRVANACAASPTGHDWRTFWLVPAAAAGAVVIAFAFLFFDREADNMAAPS